MPAPQLNASSKPERYSAPDTHAPATNTPAVVTLVAADNIQHVVKSIDYSYSGSGTLSGGLLTVAVDGVTVWQVGVEAKGEKFKTFDPPLLGASEVAVVVTLAAGGADVAGKVSVGHYLYPAPISLIEALDFSGAAGSGYVALL